MECTAIFTDALPKTPSGKIMRRLLKEIMTTGQVGSDVTALERPYIVFGLTVTFPSSFESTLAGMAS
jgi:hypothetical protein